MDENKSQAPANTDEYIAQFPEDIQQILQKIRAVIKETAPEATEKIGYQMPGFYLNGGLVWFAAHTHHIGLYPTPSGTEAFEELQQYRASKGSLHFPLDQPIPYDVIRKVVQFRVEENLNKKKKKAK